MAADGGVARILAQSLDLRSALGPHTVALIRVLEAEGHLVTLDVEDRRGVPREFRRLLASPDARAGTFAPAALTILQYPIWFPLAERFRQATGAKIFWYHGVTPSGLWDDVTVRDLLRRSEAGAELAWHAHLAVADSPFAAQELHRHSGYPAGRIRVVPIGLDAARLRERPPEDVLASLRSRWGLTARRVLLYVGRVAGNKRVDLLVQALALLIDRHADLHLLVVGDDESMPAYRDLALRLRSQADQLGIGDRMTFTGRVESTYPFYHLAEVCVLPSQHEGFGVPLVESMVAGVPIVASSSGAIPWVLDAESEEGEPAGLTFSPGSTHELAAQIQRVLDDPALRSTLVQRGRKRAEDFSMRKFEDLTRGVLAEAEALTHQESPPANQGTQSRLYEQADVSLREYRVRSRVPLVGRLIEILRTMSTSHIKGPYLDRIVEQQVLFNRALVKEIERLQLQVQDLQDQLSRRTQDP